MSIRFSPVALALLAIACSRARVEPHCPLPGEQAKPWVSGNGGESRADRGDADAPLLPAACATAVDAKFLVFGDSGFEGSGQQPVVARAMRKVCDRQGCAFALHTGDIISPAGITGAEDPQLQSKFEDIYRVLDLPIFLALGNHDYHRLPNPRPQDVQAAIDYTQVSPSKHWILPARHYDFRRGGVHFVAIDSSAIASPLPMPGDSAAQGKWLDQKLAASSMEPWTIVFGHHPRLSCPGRGNGPGHGMPEVDYARWFDSHISGKADIYFCGHDHNLQVWGAWQGTHHVVSGGGGATLYETERGSTALMAKSTFGFFWVHAEGTTLELQAFDKNGAKLFSHTYRRAGSCQRSKSASFSASIVGS